MRRTDRSVLIPAVIGVLEGLNREANKELVKQNLYTEQKAFDRVGLFFDLVFMGEKEFQQIARLTIG